MTRRAGTIRLLCAAPLAFSLSGDAGADHASAPRAETALTRYEFHEPHMGTLVRVVLYAGDERHARRASRAAFDRVAALD
ncbi:MAG: hypothetical protein ACRD2X_22950, partial [Vicinamibacteraceae bacterium]